MADKDGTEKKLNRSTAYPGINLEKAIEATKLLRENLGSGPYSRDSAASALGYKGVSGASVQKISACVHFGLLTRTGNAYSQSAIADQIFRSISDDEHQQAIIAAAQSPTLYEKLISEFNGKALPKMLDNVLVRSYGITERVAKEAATTFTQSMQFSGILENGIITLSAGDTTAPESDGEQIESGADDDARGDVDAVPPSPKGYVPVVIPDTDIRILFPIQYAYDLSIGRFATGIGALADNVKQVSAESTSDEPSTSA